MVFVSSEPPTARQESQSPVGYRGKRILDLSIILLSLPIIVPLLAIIYLCISVTGGNALYRQTRIGRNGQPFEILKFRTMHANSENLLNDFLSKHPEKAEQWAAFRKIDNDPRVTKLGRVLRALSLDELPQVINVVTGDMSLVGHRPFVPNEKRDYFDNGKSMAYLQLRPGLTGFSQINGRHRDTLEQRIAWNEKYASECSFLLDLKIIFSTFAVIVRKTGQ